MKNTFLCISFLVFLLSAGCSETKKTITKIDDVKNSVIGAMTGTTGEQLIKDKFPSAELKSFDDIMDAIVSLKGGQLEAVITTWPTAMNACRHNPGLRYLPDPVDIEYTALAVAKGNEELLAQLNKFIEQCKADGTLGDMKRRWFKEDLTPYEEADIILPSNGKVLRVGTSATREPFSFVNAEGEVTGHEGEFARRAGVYLGRPVQFFDMKFAALIPALQSGRIDIICAGMTATEERRKSVNFTDSYFQNSQVFIIRKEPSADNSAFEESLNLRTKDDLKDKKIGVLLGSIHDSYAAKEFPSAVIQHYNSPLEVIVAVRTGKADAALFTTEILQWNIRGDKQLTIWGDTLFGVPVGMGFNKNNAELKEKFNLFLMQIRNDGILKEMTDRYLVNHHTDMPFIENLKNNGTLAVGTVVERGLPFSSIVNGRPAGFDVELCERFAAYLGKEIRWIETEFGSIIMAAASNKADMISSTLMINEERKKQVDFSDEYLRLGASILVLKKNIAGYAEPGGKQADSPFLDGLSESFYNNIIAENRYMIIIDGLRTTIVISILSVILGTLLGGLICYMRMSSIKYLTITAKLYINLLRGTPVLVLLLIIFYIVFASVDINPVIAAVIAFGLNFAAYVSEMYRTGIESIDTGQTEAALAGGFTKLKSFRYIILPQAARRILPVYKGEVISLVKMTSVVGYVAVQDITKASDIIRGRTFDAFFPLILVAILYFIISWVFIFFLSYLEKRTSPAFKRNLTNDTQANYS